jgi:hypothetical protein
VSNENFKINDQNKKKNSYIWVMTIRVMEGKWSQRNEKKVMETVQKKNKEYIQRDIYYGNNRLSSSFLCVEHRRIYSAATWN